jgi:hypothetical protein
MKSNLKGARTVAIAAALILLTSSSALAAWWTYVTFSTADNGGIYSQLQADWQEWALTQPAASNPVLDPTGDLCGNGQSGKYFFLAGSFDGTPVNRTCTVSASKTLFFPIVNESYLAFPEDLEGMTPAQQEAYVRAQNVLTARATGLSLKIDGVPQLFVPPFIYLRESKTFALSLSDIYGEDYDGQVIPMGADKGYYAMVAISPGKHTLEWTGSVAGSKQDVKYTLNVTR